jgi:hypothetical protein
MDWLGLAAIAHGKRPKDAVKFVNNLLRGKLGQKPTSIRPGTGELRERRYSLDRNVFGDFRNRAKQRRPKPNSVMIFYKRNGDKVEIPLKNHTKPSKDGTARESSID